MGARVTRCSGNATGAQRRAYSRGCVASTASRPVAVGVGGAERGAPMSQRAYRRVRVAATPKPPVAKEGATGSRLSGAARRQDPLREQRVPRLRWVMRGQDPVKEQRVPRWLDDRARSWFSPCNNVPRGTLRSILSLTPSRSVASMGLFDGADHRHRQSEGWGRQGEDRYQPRGVLGGGGTDGPPGGPRPAGPCRTPHRGCAEGPRPLH